MLKRVYHSSKVQGLEILRPRRSTHGKSWIYAMRDMVIAAFFLSGEGGDLTCQIGRDGETGLPYVCERFAGAFSHRYRGRKGSIYTLPGERFLRNKTPWEEEVVCPTPVEPEEELGITDAEEYLKKLEQEGKILIKYFPNKIDGIPDDNSDLVKKIVYWIGQHGDKVLKEVQKYHPQLVENILEEKNKKLF